MGKRNYYIGSLILASIFFLQSCVPVGSSSGTGSTSYYSNKELKTEDKTYENNIKTVLLYPSGGNVNDVFVAPTVPLSQQKPLVLEFDEINGKTNTYYSKIIHCNADWSRSSLPDIMFMYDYNDFLITTYSLSTATNTQYMHFKYTLPKVKLTGNYVVIVYRDGKEDDIVLSKRFIVYGQQINIAAKINFCNVTQLRESHQQVDFSVGYGNLNITNPQDLYVVVRQNNRWDNAKMGIKPLYIKDYEKVLDFGMYDGSNAFAGGNEFRFFDTRSIITPGMNINRIVLNPLNVKINEDRSRNFPAYSQNPDVNGSFVIGRRETNDGSIDGEYVPTTFTFKSKDYLYGKLYVTGAFSNWQLTPQYQLEYDSTSNSYSKTLTLKQGYYNYQYVLVDKNKPDEIQLEGSYYQTENNYEIIVYYRQLGAINDIIVGYQSLKSYYR